MKSLLKYILCLVFFQANAQQYYINTYSADQGLTHPQITRIVQDKQGSIWVGSLRGGLCRFNGKVFTPFTQEQGLLDNSVQDIFVDSLHNRFIISTLSGYSIYDGLTFKNDTLANSFHAQFIQDKQGRIWLLRIAQDRSSRLFLFENEKFVAQKLALNDIQAITAHPQKGIYLSSNRGLIEFDGNNMLANVFQFPQTMGKLVMPFIDSKGQTWLQVFTPGSSVIRFNIEAIYQVIDNQLVPFTLPMPCTTYKMYQNKRGQIWFVTNEGMFRYDGKEFLHISTKNGLPSHEIYDILEDKEHNLWFAPIAMLAKISDFTFSRFTAKDGLQGSEIIFALLEDQKYGIWFGVRNGALARYDGKQLTNYINVSTFGLAEDKVGNILISALNSGLQQYDGKNFTNITESLSLPPVISHIRTIDDSLWISTNKGVYKVRQAQLYGKEKATLVVAKLQANIIFQDKDKKIWIGTQAGIVRYDGKSQVMYNEKNGLSTGIVSDILQDKWGRLWICTYNGLFMYQEASDRFVMIPKKDIPPSIFYAIDQDKQGNIWINSRDGLDKVTFDATGNIIKSKRYNKYNGLLGVPTLANLVDRNGDVWIGTSTGAARYNPQEEIQSKQAPQTYLSNIKLFFKDITWSDSIYSNYHQGIAKWFNVPQKLQLPYTQNHLSFIFESTTYRASEQVKYQWKLEGSDADWLPPVSENKAEYPNLPTGKYTFLVKAANSDGVWNEKPTVYEFEILPPFWQTWWFKLIVGTLLIGGIFIAIRTRINNLEAQRQKLEKLVIERTQDIANKNKVLEEQQKEIKTQNANLRELNEEVNQQKEELETQRDSLEDAYAEIEKKNKDITSSITYAKRIQEAILPFKERIAQSLGAENFFILYQPRDIISGDFYFYEQIDNQVIIAVADCTGHGVPGAFMSMIGTQLLNEIILKNRITAPDQILNLLHQEIRRTLKQSENQSRDGMDMALITLTKNEQSTGFSQLEYAGAMNPLFLIQDNQLTDVSANKRPIGGFQKEDNRSFTKHKLHITAPRTLYLFSDGYADQFGGKDNRKFMVKNFKNLLLEIHSLPMNTQKQVLKDKITRWMEESNQSQIDDILVMGIQIA